MMFTDIPIVIISFERYAYLRHMVEQFLELSVTRSDIVIVDNASTYRPLQGYLDELEHHGHPVLRMSANRGYKVAFEPDLWVRWPRFVAITDPDLSFRSDIPRTFRSDLAMLAQAHRMPKVGCALDISDAHLFVNETDYARRGVTIEDWERQFWIDRIDETEPPVYRAFVDTTFAVYDKTRYRHSNHLEALRVAGSFTAKHIPWYRREAAPIACVPSHEEEEIYARSSWCSSLTLQKKGYLQ